MAENLACDTTFLIDLQRPVRSRAGLAAREFLRVHSSDRFFLPAIALGEFAAGFTDERDPTLVEIVRHFSVLNLDEPIAFVYRTLFRELQSNGQLIGANDLWIAATAIHHMLPLVTSNAREFSRIRQLRILRY